MPSALLALGVLTPMRASLHRIQADNEKINVVSLTLDQCVWCDGTKAARLTVHPLGKDLNSCKNLFVTSSNMNNFLNFWN